MSRGSACYTVEVEEHEDTLRVYTTLDSGVGGTLRYKRYHSHETAWSTSSS
jgi:hypothetical protein